MISKFAKPKLSPMNTEISFEAELTKFSANRIQRFNTANNKDCHETWP
jgi:hypothetical protein